MIAVTGRRAVMIALTGWVSAVVYVDIDANRQSAIYVRPYVSFVYVAYLARWRVSLSVLLCPSLSVCLCQCA